MPEVLFVGGRRDSVTVVSGTIPQITDNTRFDPAYSDCALRVNSISSFKIDLYTETSNVLSKTNVGGSGTTVFVHFVVRSTLPNNVDISPFCTLVDSDGFPWFYVGASINPRSTTSFNIYWNSGTGSAPIWTEIGTSLNITTLLETWDIEFTFGSPHTVNVYRNGSIWRSGSFTQAAFTNISSVLFTRISAGVGNPIHDISQIIVTEGISTIGSFVKTLRATAVGSNTGFSNDHTAVNAPIETDATVQVANTPGLRTTHVMGDISVPTGLEIKTVFHWLRAKNDGTSPNNIRSVLRSSGIDFVTPDMPLLNIGYSPVGARYNSDPLGTNWTETEWNNIEAGYESAT